MSATTWFSGTDKLAGTFETGTQGKDDAEWAIMFSTLIFDTFLFATGDFSDWMIAPKASITTQTSTGDELRPITSSSISSVSMDILIYNRSGYATDPTFWLDKTTRTFGGRTYNSDGDAISASGKSIL